jgi:hypothetical protein
MHLMIRGWRGDTGEVHAGAIHRADRAERQVTGATD